MIFPRERLSSWMASATLWLGVAGLLGGCGGGGESVATLESLNLAAFSTARAERGPFEVVIEEMGVAEAAETAIIKSPIYSKIAWIEKDGTRVDVGHVVARLDVEEYVRELRTSVSELKLGRKNMESSVEQLEQQFRDTALDYERSLAGLEFNRSQLVDLNRDLESLRALAELALVAETNVESRMAELDSGKLETYQSDLDFQTSQARARSEDRLQRSQLAQLAFQSSQGLVEARELRRQVDSSELRAPVAGVWTIARNWDWQAGRQVPVAEGREVRTGWTLGQVAAGEEFIVRSQVSESKISFIREGTSVRLASTALKGMEFSGTISRVGSAAMERKQSPAGAQMEQPDYSGLKVFEIEMKLEEGAAQKAGGRLSNGMTMDVVIVIDRIDDIAIAPLAAIHQEEGLPVVFIRQPGGKVEKRRVILGPRRKDKAAIREGLQGDEELYLTDLNAELEKLRAGQNGSGASSGA
jgi:multidrug resistance efflux pump